MKVKINLKVNEKSSKQIIFWLILPSTGREPPTCASPPKIPFKD